MTVKDIDRNVYHQEVLLAGRTALLCCCKTTISPDEALGSIEAISRQFESIQFYVIQEQEHEFFFETLRFLGTPVFIFFVNGIERGRLLGTVTPERLTAFVNRKINELETP